VLLVRLDYIRSLQWCAAIVTELGVDETLPLLATMLRPVRRIAQTTGSGGSAAAGAAASDISAPEKESLRLLSKEFCDIVKKKVGEVRFASAYSAVDKMAGAKRMERRKQAAVLKVVDPRSAAVKKVNRKRKGGGGAKAGKVKAKKPKLKDLAMIE